MARKKRLFAFSLSFATHLSILSAGSFISAQSFPIHFDQNHPLLIKLESIQPKPLVPEISPKSIQAAALSEKSETPFEKKVSLRKVEPETVTQSIRSKTDWDQAEFQRKQAQIDEKIGAIRRQLRRAVAKQRNQQIKTRTSQGFEVLSVGLDGEKWNEYLAAVRQKVLKNWYPYLVQHEKNLVPSEVRLDFALSHGGQVKYYRVADWNGSAEFRDLCLRAFQETVPFPPLPVENSKKKGGNLVRVSLFFYYR